MAADIRTSPADALFKPSCKSGVAPRFSRVAVTAGATAATEGAVMSDN